MDFHNPKQEKEAFFNFLIHTYWSENSSLCIQKFRKNFEEILFVGNDGTDRTYE